MLLLLLSLLLLLLLSLSLPYLAEGDYNIIVPSDTAAGMYKIRVGLFGDDSVFGCSETFEIVPPGNNYWLDTNA